MQDQPTVQQPQLPPVEPTAAQSSQHPEQFAGAQPLPERPPEQLALPQQHPPGGQPSQMGPQSQQQIRQPEPRFDAPPAEQPPAPEPSAARFSQPAMQGPGQQGVPLEPQSGQQPQVTQEPQIGQQPQMDLEPQMAQQPRAPTTVGHQPQQLTAGSAPGRQPGVGSQYGQQMAQGQAQPQVETADTQLLADTLARRLGLSSQQLAAAVPELGIALESQQASSHPGDQQPIAQPPVSQTRPPEPR